MAGLELDSSLESLELANRRRLVAQSIADLHYVDAALGLGEVIADDGLPFGVSEATKAHASPHFYLSPSYVVNDVEGSKTYTGFSVHEAVAEGGAAYSLVYKKTSDGNTITLDYAEFDDDGEVESSPVESLADRDYSTKLFVTRANAAFMAVHGSAKDKAKFAAWARWEQESNVRWLRNARRIPFVDGVWVPEGLRRLVRV